MVWLRPKLTITINTQVILTSSLFTASDDCLDRVAQKKYVCVILSVGRCGAFRRHRLPENAKLRLRPTQHVGSTVMKGCKRCVESWFDNRYGGCYANVAEREIGKMTKDVGEWAKEFEAKLAELAPDMRATEALLEQEGFRVDSGNKSFSGWWLTAYNKTMRQEKIKVQSDGSKIVVTVAGP